MNCGSCIHLEQDCEYKEYKKCMELDIYTSEHEEVLSVNCDKYTSRIGNEVVCPYCNSNETEYVDMIDRDLDYHNCMKCDEYFYVEMNGDTVVEVRKTKWGK